MNNNNDLLQASSIVPELKVVNDHAERGVVLIQEYCGLITKDKQQLQLLLRIIQEHRKNFPKSGKKAQKQ